MTDRTIEINEAFMPLADAPVRFVECYGGRDSGKSVAVSQLLVLRAIQHKRRVMVMRKIASTIFKSVWERMKAALAEAGIAYEQNKTEKEIRLPNGSQFWFVGMDDPEKLKSIEEITDVWLEEATEFREADFDTINIGLRANVDPVSQIWLTHNPIPIIPGAQHWIQERFLGVAHELGKVAVRGDVAVLRTWYKNNAFCAPAVMQELERLRTLNPSLYRMWALGEFVALEGVILDGNWDVVTEVPREAPLIGNGIDFGFAQDPAAVIRVWGDPKSEIWVKECVYETGLLNRELGAAMAEEGLQRSEVSVADSAEPKSIADLQSLGWTMLPSTKGPDYKRFAAQSLRSLRIHVLEGSTNCIKEFATWSWKRDRQDNPMPIPADGNDHCVDALIYLTMKFAKGPAKVGKQRAKRKPVTAGYRTQLW